MHGEQTIQYKQLYIRFPKSAAHRDNSREWGRLKAKLGPLLTLGYSGKCIRQRASLRGNDGRGVQRHQRHSYTPRGLYRGTSLIRNIPPLGPYSRTMSRALWWSWGRGAVSYERGTPVRQRASLHGNDGLGVQRHQRHSHTPRGL